MKFNAYCQYLSRGWRSNFNLVLLAKSSYFVPDLKQTSLTSITFSLLISPPAISFNLLEILPSLRVCDHSFPFSLFSLFGSTSPIYDRSRPIYISYNTSHNCCLHFTLLQCGRFFFFLQLYYQRSCCSLFQECCSSWPLISIWLTPSLPSYLCPMMATLISLYNIEPLTLIQYCAGKCLTISSLGKKVLISTFVHFHAINTPIVANFSLPTWHHWVLTWEDMHTMGSWEPTWAAPAHFCTWHSLPP